MVGGRETCLTAGIRAGTRGAKLLSVTNDLYHPPLLACTVRSYHRLVAEVAQPAFAAAMRFCDGGDAAAGRHHGTPPAPEIAVRMRAGGLSPHGWGNGLLGDACGMSGYEKMLYRVRGQIVFRAAGGDIELGPGDNMVLRFTAPGRFLPAWTARDHDVR